MNEPKECLVGHWIRKFMLEHLGTVRNCSPQTRKSYRDAYRKLLPYVAKKCGRSVDALRVADVSRDRVLSFLDHLERDCGNSARTRNQKLAAIMSLAKYISTQSPELVEWFGSLRSIPSKKTTNRLITYLERGEMDAIMSAPDSSTEQYSFRAGKPRPSAFCASMSRAMAALATRMLACADQLSTAASSEYVLPAAVFSLPSRPKSGNASMAWFFPLTDLTSW